MKIGDKVNIYNSLRTEICFRCVTVRYIYANEVYIEESNQSYPLYHVQKTSTEEYELFWKNQIKEKIRVFKEEAKKLRDFRRYALCKIEDRGDKAVNEMSYFKGEEYEGF